MKKFLLFFIITCFSVTLSAQDWLNSAFAKSLEYVTAINKNEWYKGQISNKIKHSPRHGMGICKYADGTLYIGDFSNGIVSGYGIQLAAEGQIISNCDNCAIYSGNWKSGVKSGEGTCYDKNGDIIYFGNFENDMPVDKYPTEEDFSLYKFSVIEYDNGDKYLGEINEYSLDGYGVYIWANGDLWLGNFKDDQRNGIGIYLFYNAEWATLNCKYDDCTQMTSSVEQRERDEANKEMRAQVRMQNLALIAGALSDVATGIGQVQSLVNRNSGSTTTASNTGGNTQNSGGCNCANLQSLYTRAYQKSLSGAGTAGNARGKEIVGAITGGEYGDNSAGNAAVKSSANQLVRTAQQEMSRLQQQAAKCGCTLK